MQTSPGSGQSWHSPAVWLLSHHTHGDPQIFQGVQLFLGKSGAEASGTQNTWVLLESQEILSWSLCNPRHRFMVTVKAPSSGTQLGRGDGKHGRPGCRAEVGSPGLWLGSRAITRPSTLLTAGLQECSRGLRGQAPVPRSPWATHSHTGAGTPPSQSCLPQPRSRATHWLPPQTRGPSKAPGHLGGTILRPQFVCCRFRQDLSMTVRVRRAGVQVRAQLGPQSSRASAHSAKCAFPLLDQSGPK